MFFRTDNNDVASTADADEGNVSFIVNGTLKVGGEIIGNSTGDGDGVASLQLNSGSTLELSGATNFIDIHPDNNEVLIDAHATIVYAGSSTQQIFEGITYGDLKLSGGGDKELTSDIIVSNTLILESGDVLTGANKLIVESTASDAIQGGSENSYIVGNLQRAVDASTTYAFPIGQGGDADGYNPFTLEVMAGLSGTETVEASFTSAMETIDEERTCETDGGTQRLSYACAVGNWDITSNDFSYEITLQPSAATQADCPNEGVSLFPSIRKVEGGDQSLGCNEGIADVPFNSFSTFSIAYAALAVAAPVELLGFDVEAQGTAAVLWWATAIETNNSHFEIERSSDGFSYEVIALVEGMGTAFEAQEYSYTDSMAGPGWHYYRLKQVDLNGEYEYFSIREVELSGRSSLQAAVLVGYPNPADNYYKMEMEIPDPKNAMIKVFDLRGNQIYHAMIANCASGYNAIEMDVSTWQSGIYMYMITAGADVIRGKIVKT
ncbi:MAG: T9SS type A sorting domain-containing protein [Bacteroidota bacterium]